MKLSWGLAVSSLCWSASAATKSGYVFVYDPTAPQTAPQQSAVSPETARLILAQRLGVSQYHSIQDPSDEVLRHINAYGGRQRKIFGSYDIAQHREKPKAHVLVWIEDVEDVEAIIPQQVAELYSSRFTISNPPPPFDNNRLLKDFVAQAKSLPKKDDPLHRTAYVGINTDLVTKAVKKINVYNDYLTVFYAEKSDNITTSQMFHTLLEVFGLSKAQGEMGWPVTVVLMPPSSSKKRSAHPYGVYDRPAIVDARREKTEALLSPSPSEPSKAPISDVPDLEDFPTIQQAKDDSPVLGILPSCFTSQTACEKQTRNCSGHGACTQARKGDGKGRQDCYSCQCVPTNTTKGANSLTTYWGGPACQKKDISVPFWLFVSTGVILAFLISAGIGMLYSMGGEELPSVIGAGVSGPVKK